MTTAAKRGKKEEGGARDCRFDKTSSCVCRERFRPAIGRNCKQPDTAHSDPANPSLITPSNGLSPQCQGACQPLAAEIQSGATLAHRATLTSTNTQVLENPPLVTRSPSCHNDHSILAVAVAATVGCPRHQCRKSWLHCWRAVLCCGELQPLRLLDPHLQASGSSRTAAAAEQMATLS